MKSWTQFKLPALMIFKHIYKSWTTNFIEINSHFFQSLNAILFEYSEQSCKSILDFENS